MKIRCVIYATHLETQTSIMWTYCLFPILCCGHFMWSPRNIFSVLGKPHISILSTRNVICTLEGGGGRAAVTYHGKIRKFFSKTFNISESSLQNIKKKLLDTNTSLYIQNIFWVLLLSKRKTYCSKYNFYCYLPLLFRVKGEID